MAASFVLLTGAGAVSAAGPQPITSIAPLFIALDDIVVPIIDGNFISGRMRFKAIIAANDAAGQTRLQLIKPRLRSESLATGIEFSRLHASGLRPVDAAALATALTTALRQSHPDVGHVLLVKTAANIG